MSDGDKDTDDPKVTSMTPRQLDTILFCLVYTWNGLLSTKAGPVGDDKFTANDIENVLEVFEVPSSELMNYKLRILGGETVRDDEW